MSIVVFIAYSILFSWMLQRIPFVKRAGIPSAYLILFFLLKVAAGVAYGYIHYNAPEHVGITDTWKFFYQGCQETPKIIKDPWLIFGDIVPKEVPYDISKILSTNNSYWNDVKHELMVKLAAVLNIFSGSRYYVNVVIYNFLTMAGPIALYRMVTPRVSSSRLAYLLAFAIPTQLFWCSGFHKEGILFTALSLVLYTLDKWAGKLQIRLSLYMVSAISLLLILLLRNNLLLPLLPVALGCILLRFFPARPWWLLGGICTLGFLMFFLSPLVGFNLPGLVAERQHEFITLGGRTAVTMQPLDPSLSGFMQHFPKAVMIGLLLPFPGEGGLAYLPFAIETYALLVLGAYMAWRSRKNNPSSALAAAFLLLAFLNCLMIGYTVPNIGAVIRYKSITTPFFFSAIAIWWSATGRKSN